MNIVGRKKERKILAELYHSTESEFLVILGRRRIGKTYLIREYYQDKITFEMVGVQNASTNQQLATFLFSLQQSFDIDSMIKTPSDWLEAFQLLIKTLEAQTEDKKHVVFIDELPWIATARSNFLEALGFFWNNWASKNNILLITCGSASSWMIQKLFNNKGGLHNRISRSIQLQAFDIAETREYLTTRNIELDDKQLSQLYMIIGGIPYYLKMVPRGKSVNQIINYLCFEKQAPLRNEFNNLYAALFSHSERYIAVIEACFSKWKGVTQTEIIKLSGIASGGSLTRILEDLEISGFIQSYLPFDQVKKDKLYRLVDELSLFHLQFMHKNPDENWNILAQSQAYKSWLGYAFENFCLQNIEKIKDLLGIRGVLSKSASYLKKGNSEEKGYQFDLIIDRNDHTISICEIKYCDTPFVITKSYRNTIEARIQEFRNDTKTKKTIQTVFIASQGLKDNPHSEALVDQVIELKDLLN